MHLIQVLQKTIFLIIILYNATALGKEKAKYRLVFTSTDAYFFNAISDSNQVYFGTDKGVLIFDKNKPLIFSDKIKGQIEISNGNLKKGEVFFYNTYNELLPTDYQGLNTTHLQTKDFLYVICKGDLFVFIKSDYTFRSYPSVRSISSNYIGSYGGVFDKQGDTLAFPSFTDSTIREYENTVFLNWGGLSIIEGKVQKNYFAPGKGGVYIKNQNFGEAIDSYEIEHPNYLISTTKGLYLLNTDTEKINLIKKSKNGPYRFIRGERNSVRGLELLFLHDQQQIIAYNLIDSSFTPTIQRDNIVDVFSDDQSIFTILSDTKLETVNVKRPRANKTISLDIINPNNIRVLNDLYIVTSDQGLSLFAKNSSLKAINVIKDELNYNAVFVGNDTLKIGGINGLYTLSYEQLIQLLKIGSSKIEKNKANYLPFVGISLLSIIITVLIIIVFRQRIILRNRMAIESLTTREKIEFFIRQNIKNVTVEMITDTFDLNVNALYKLLGNEKPGTLIRKERIKIVRKMRLEKASEEMIAEASGFSLSYLKKI